MNREKGKNVWLVVLILSILFIGWTVFTISEGNTILQNGVKMWAGSPFDVETIEEKALGFITMAMIKPLWEEIWVGILGLFCALGLKQGNRYAWMPGLIWGTMLLATGLVQGLYEVAILDWSMPCPQTYIFLVFGLATLTSLMVGRKRYSENKMQA